MRAFTQPRSWGFSTSLKGEDRNWFEAPSSLLKILCQFFCTLHRLKAWIVELLVCAQNQQCPPEWKKWQTVSPGDWAFSFQKSVLTVLVTSEVFCYFLTAIFYTLLFFFLVSFVESTAPLLARWLHLKMQLQDLPGGPVVKNHTPNAGTWVRSWSRKTSTVQGNLSLCAITTELASGAGAPKHWSPHSRAGAPQWQ